MSALSQARSLERMRWFVRASRLLLSLLRLCVVYEALADKRLFVEFE